jgi:hypothetical protein
MATRFSPIPLASRDSVCPWCFRQWKLGSEALGERTVFVKCSGCGAEVIIIKPEKEK